MGVGLRSHVANSQCLDKGTTNPVIRIMGVLQKNRTDQKGICGGKKKENVGFPKEERAEAAQRKKRRLKREEKSQFK